MHTSPRYWTLGRAIKPTPSSALQELPVCPTQNNADSSQPLNESEPSTSPVSPTNNKHRVPSPSKKMWQVFYGPGLNVISRASCLGSYSNLLLTGATLGDWLILVGPQFSHLENGETGTHLEGLIQVKGSSQSAHGNGLWSALGNNSSYLVSPLPSRCLAGRLCSV